MLEHMGQRRMVHNTWECAGRLLYRRALQASVGLTAVFRVKAERLLSFLAGHKDNAAVESMSCRLIEASVELEDVLGIVGGFNHCVTPGALRDLSALKDSEFFLDPGVLALLTYCLHEDLPSAFCYEEQRSLGGNAFRQLLQTLQAAYDRVSLVNSWSLVQTRHAQAQLPTTLALWCGRCVIGVIFELAH